METASQAVEKALTTELREANEWIGQLSSALAAALADIRTGNAAAPGATMAKRSTLVAFMQSPACSSELRATLEQILSR